MTHPPLTGPSSAAFRALNITAMDTKRPASAAFFVKAQVFRLIPDQIW
jgi:hypothetical protein